ncbi:MAG: hypothetical protein J1F23_02090 [Oscillospiraceae bacterium]|nr:hypothetical protein [Oscillospiraceae bacterium]
MKLNMSELSRIVRSFLISSIITLLITLAFCGVFIAEGNTARMLFG